MVKTRVLFLTTNGQIDILGLTKFSEKFFSPVKSRRWSRSRRRPDFRERFRNDPAFGRSRHGSVPRLGRTTRFRVEVFPEEPDIELSGSTWARCSREPWIRRRVVQWWLAGHRRWTCPRCESSSLLLLPRTRPQSARGARPRQPEAWAWAATRGLRWPWQRRCTAWSSSRTGFLPRDEADRQPCCPMPERRNQRDLVWSPTKETTT